ncbi:uncharacterized protein LOC135254930 [Anguilla rostrata]|uniref:uncharacterized protein LOC135254930 n=1 Tax=Anguilla rostrata TaxID=7938 RepID=UPI0030CA7BC0
METSLCSKQTEIRCAEQIPSLTAWVIEYAWSHRMMDVLEGLVPCKRQKGECRSLTLEEPCALRVAAAQAWSVVNARDVKHFESLLELLESIYTLVPRLITPIKHMKIMFGLKTMIVMWMLQKNHGEVSTMKKINRFFPSSLSLYHGCSKRELDLMKKTNYEFKQLAQSLLFHEEMRKAYISGQMEEHYGERYAQKLEERLFDYLQLLEKDLQPTTCLDQVLRQERPLVEGEQLLLGVLNYSPHCVPAALKRLLYYAKATPSIGPGMSQPSTCTDKEKQTLQPLTDPKDRPNWTPLPAGQPGLVRSSMSHSSWKACGKEKATSTPLCSRSSCAEGRSDRAEQRLRKQGLSLGGWSHGTRGHGHEEKGLSQDKRGWDQKEKGQGQKDRRRGPGKKRQNWGSTQLAEQHCQMGDYPMQLCSRHKRWVRNILQECSVEVGAQSVGILKEYPTEVGCETVNIIEQCTKELEGQNGIIVEQCHNEVGEQTVNIMEQCPKELVGHGMNILETCSEELEGQNGIILEQCYKDVGCQNGIILEQCKKEVGCQTGNIMEECSQELEGQNWIVLEQCHKEMGKQSVNIMEQCPKELEDQSMSFLEQCPQELEGQRASFLEKCSLEFEGQNGIILEQYPQELEGHGKSILEMCSQEMVGQGVRDLEECYEVLRRNQGAIELQQILPLTSSQPVTSSRPYHSPMSYQGCGQYTASSLARVESVGLGVRISVESQLILIRSQMLQPTVRVRRLTQRECHLATGMRGTMIRPEEAEEGRDNEEEEIDGREEEGESDDWESDFSYSEVDSGSYSDPDFRPPSRTISGMWTDGRSEKAWERSGD